MIDRGGWVDNILDSTEVTSPVNNISVRNDWETVDRGILNSVDSLDWDSVVSRVLNSVNGGDWKSIDRGILNSVDGLNWKSVDSRILNSVDGLDWNSAQGRILNTIETSNAVGGGDWASDNIVNQSNSLSLLGRVSEVSSITLGVDDCGWNSSGNSQSSNENSDLNQKEKTII